MQRKYRDRVLPVTFYTCPTVDCGFSTWELSEWLWDTSRSHDPQDLQNEAIGHLQAICDGYQRDLIDFHPKPAYDEVTLAVKWLETYIGDDQRSSVAPKP